MVLHRGDAGEQVPDLGQELTVVDLEPSNRYVAFVRSESIVLLDLEMGREEIYYSSQAFTDRLRKLGLLAISLLPERPAVA